MSLFTPWLMEEGPFTVRNKPSSRSLPRGPLYLNRAQKTIPTSKSASTMLSSLPSSLLKNQSVPHSSYLCSKGNLHIQLLMWCFSGMFQRHSNSAWPKFMIFCSPNLSLENASSPYPVFLCSIVPISNSEPSLARFVLQKVGSLICSFLFHPPLLWFLPLLSS